MGTRNKIRHWKERFDPKAKFVWNQSIMFNGKRTKPGQLIPQKLRKNRNKLRRFWHANTIRLKDFVAPVVNTGQRIEKPVIVENAP